MIAHGDIAETPGLFVFATQPISPIDQLAPPRRSLLRRRRDARGSSRKPRPMVDIRIGSFQYPGKPCRGHRARKPRTREQRLHCASTVSRSSDETSYLISSSCSARSGTGHTTGGRAARQRSGRVMEQPEMTLPLVPTRHAQQSNWVPTKCIDGINSLAHGRSRESPGGAGAEGAQSLRNNGNVRIPYEPCSETTPYECSPSPARPKGLTCGEWFPKCVRVRSARCRCVKTRQAARRHRP